MFGAMLSAASSCCGSDPTLEETPMKSITRLVIAVVAVMFAVATLCPAQDVKPADLGKGAAFNGKKIEMKDKGEVAYLLLIFPRMPSSYQEVLWKQESFLVLGQLTPGLNLRLNPRNRRPTPFVRSNA